MGPKRGREEEEEPVIEVEGAKFSLDVAKGVVDAACSEANDVMETMKDPEKNKKTKTLKASTKLDVVRNVMTGDPSNVLQHIKTHKKEFISGVYSSVFMSAIRKEMSKAEAGNAGGGNAAEKEEDAGDAKRAKTEGDDSKADGNAEDGKEGTGKSGNDDEAAG